KAARVLNTVCRYPRVSQRFSDDNHRLLISSMLSTLRVEIDLNLFPLRQHPSASLRQETTGELGKNDFLSTYGLSSVTRIPPMRRSLQRQLQTPTFLLLGPISLHGIRATDLSGEPTRYRSMLTFRWHKA